MVRGGGWSAGMQTALPHLPCIACLAQPSIPHIHAKPSTWLNCASFNPAPGAPPQRAQPACTDSLQSPNQHALTQRSRLPPQCTRAYLPALALVVLRPSSTSVREEATRPKA